MLWTRLRRCFRLRVVTTPFENDIAETDREELPNGYTVPEPQGFEGGKEMASAGKSYLPACIPK